MELNVEKYVSRTPRPTKHVLFWLLYIAFFGILYGSFNEDYVRQLQIQLLYLPEKLIATYLVIYLLMPAYLLKSRYGIFFFLLFAILFISGFVHWTTSLYIEKVIFWPNEDWNASWFHMGKIVKSITHIYPVVAIAVVIKLFKRWYVYQNAAQQLVQEKLGAELKFLKAQIHPHFLFNTLNNLYALTLKKSDKAPDVVLKLSSLLSYMLYECNAETVPLSKEIELLETYIALEKIRYDKRLDITYRLKGEVGTKTIAPMLILAFVENSFKHGVSDEIEGAWISIDITISTKELALKVDNSKSKQETEDSSNYKEGIGLNNVKRRLELLYPNNHELKIIDSEESYLVMLHLKVNPGL